MPTIAELRERAKGGPVPLPRHSEKVTLTTGQHILDRLGALARERADLEWEIARRDANPEDFAPLKSGEKGPGVRLEQVKAEEASLYGTLAEHQGVVGLTGMKAGEWQRWKDDHPARPDNDTDERVTAGFCSFAALLDNLGKFVTSWDDEDLEPGAWDAWLSDQVATADHRELVRAVVEMHEIRVRSVPKSSTASSSTESSETA